MAKIITTVLLLNGDPRGIKIIEIDGWSGKAFFIPRASLQDLKNRSEVELPGVYFLFGESENLTRQRLYIGESENWFDRLMTHNDKKDFWDTALVFTGSLDKADVKYMENQAVRLAKDADRYEIDNKTEPTENRLSEVKKIAADNYFERIQLIAAVFGLKMFEDVPKPKDAPEIYHFDTENAKAEGAFLESGEFVVYAGSTARIKESPSFKGGGPALRKRLEIENILSRENNESFIFLKDYVFTSPSAAGDTVAGRSVNGWSKWKDKEGKTLDQNLRGPGKYEAVFKLLEEGLQKILTPAINPTYSIPGRRNYLQVKFSGLGNKHFEWRFVRDKHNRMLEIALHSEPSEANNLLEKIYNSNKTLIKELGGQIEYEKWGTNWERIYELHSIPDIDNLNPEIIKVATERMKRMIEILYPLVK